LNAANLALQKKRNELTLDVRRKARLVREAELGGEVARLELQLAQENVRVLQAQFDQGRGSLKNLEAAARNCLSGGREFTPDNCLRLKWAFAPEASGPKGRHKATLIVRPQGWTSYPAPPGIGSLGQHNWISFVPTQPSFQVRY
jgi:hypothetical protein